MNELLQELRVAQTGVQIALRLSLTLGLQAALRRHHRGPALDLCGDVAAVGGRRRAAGRARGGASGHLPAWREDGAVLLGHRLFTAGLAVLAVTLAGAVLLVLDVAVGSWFAVPVALATLFLLLRAVVPVPVAAARPPPPRSRAAARCTRGVDEVPLTRFSRTLTVRLSPSLAPASLTLPGRRPAPTRSPRRRSCPAPASGEPRLPAAHPACRPAQRRAHHPHPSPQPLSCSPPGDAPTPPITAAGDADTPRPASADAWRRSASGCRPAAPPPAGHRAPGASRTVPGPARQPGSRAVTVGPSGPTRQHDLARRLRGGDGGMLTVAPVAGAVARPCTWGRRQEAAAPCGRSPSGWRRTRRAGRGPRQRRRSGCADPTAHWRRPPERQQPARVHVGPAAALGVGLGDHAEAALHPLERGQLQPGARDRHRAGGSGFGDWAVSRPSPPAAVAPEPTKTNGISG